MAVRSHPIPLGGVRKVKTEGRYSENSMCVFWKESKLMNGLCAVQVMLEVKPISLRSVMHVQVVYEPLRAVEHMFT